MLTMIKYIQGNDNMKTFKKFVSLLLTLILVLSCAGTAFAAESSTDDSYDHFPQIYVTALVSTNIYFEDDPTKTHILWPMDYDRLLSNLTHIDQYIAKSIENREPDVLKTIIYEFCMESFGMLALKPDSVSSMEGICVEETGLGYAGDGKYYFYYDSRLSPLDCARKLHEYVKWVQEDSGSEKIEVVGSSYGANVVAAYLELYKDQLDWIDSLILCVPSVLGIEYFGALMSGELEIDPTALTDFVRDYLGAEGIGAYLSILNKSGVLELLVESLLEPVMREAVYDAILDVARDFLATLPAMWATIPNEYFEASLINMFGENYMDPNHEYAVTIKKAIEYNERVTKRADEILLYATETYKDLKLSILAKYGYPAIPLSKNGNVMDDGLVLLEAASFGATSTKYGEQFSADYVQAAHNEVNFISPDRCIDASTCLFPYNTWFLKNFEHSEKNTEYLAFVDRILYEDLDVFSDPELPQFMQKDPDDPDGVIPTVAVEPRDDSLFANIRALIKSVMLIPVKLFEKIKSLFVK